MKHESHSRVCSVSSPARSVVSSTVLQKHVGQTSVQLPQLRQRSATSSQRGCSAFACSRSRMSVTSSVRPIDARARSAAASGARRSSPSASRCSSAASTSAPRSLPTSTTKRWPSSSSSSVSARSKPAVTRGPVSIEAQKHVPPARPQLTATKKASRRRAS